MTVRPALPWKQPRCGDATVLLTSGALATKRIWPTHVEGYGAGTLFTTDAVAVENIDDLAEVLQWLLDQRHTFLIRGQQKRSGVGPMRRLCHDKTDLATGDVIPAVFESQPRRWLLIDVDDLPVPRGYCATHPEQAGAAARRAMPPELRRAACVVALTSSAGFKPGIRCRLAYWCDRPVSDAEVKRWLKDHPVDLALYNPVQPHFTAAPWITSQVDDPCPDSRLAVLEGAPEVMVPPLLDPDPAVAADPCGGLWAPLYDPAVAEENVDPNWHAEVCGRGDACASACLQRLEAAAPGSGRQTLRGVGLAVYGLAKGGLVDPYVVTAEIKRVMLARGWSDDAEARGHTTGNVNELLCWCWEHATPRGV